MFTNKIPFASSANHGHDFVVRTHIVGGQGRETSPSYDEKAWAVDASELNDMLAEHYMPAVGDMEAYAGPASVDMEASPYHK